MEKIVFNVNGDCHGFDDAFVTDDAEVEMLREKQEARKVKVGQTGIVGATSPNNPDTPAIVAALRQEPFYNSGS